MKEIPFKDPLDYKSGYTNQFKVCFGRGVSKEELLKHAEADGGTIYMYTETRNKPFKEVWYKDK